MKHILTAVVLAVLVSGAQAETAPGPDIRGTIQSQISAFEMDDFAKAFTFASPTIQSIFGSPERFGTMVRNGYPMVWRPEEVRFLELREINGFAWQKVLIRDGQGGVHILDYQMVPGPDGWRINAVQLHKQGAGNV